MAKYKAYPEYKDSGVEWLGEIPMHWQRFPLKYLVEMKSGESITAADIEPEGNYPVYGGNGLRGYSSKYTHSGSYVLIGRQGALCGNVNYAHNQFWASEHALVVKGKKSFNIRWLGELLRAMNLNQYSITAAQPGLSAEALVNLQIPVPPEAEREAVASFIGYEAGKIDNLIEKQQQLIELLKEKRQAVISHAVTKGLNPGVPMKDSGVEWLGEVPEHWGVTRLKYECRNIVDCPHSTPNYTDEGEYPAIRTADILAGHLDLENCRRVTEAVYDERNFRLIPKAGDIIYSREGERFGIGAPIPEGAKVCLAQRVMLFRAKSTPGYLMWALNSSSTYTQAQQDCIGSTSPHVNVDTIKNLILAWPPKKEREEISNFIYQTLDSIESLTVHLTEKLTLLQERRTALISAAVTGKIDVRDWVAPETSEIEVSQEATA